MPRAHLRRLEGGIVLPDESLQGHDRRPKAAFVLAALFALSGCGTDEAPSPETPTGSARAETPLMECERDGYPCRWAEVDSAALVNTARVGRIAAAAMKATRDPEAVLRLLSDGVELAESGIGSAALRFRLPGSRGVWIPLPHDEHNPHRGGVEGVGPRSVGSRSIGPTGAGPWDGSKPAPTVSVQSGEGEGDRIGGEPGSGKHALVLSAAWYQIGKEAADVYQKFASTRDYAKENGGSVTFHANFSRVYPNDPPELQLEENMKLASGHVTVDDLLGWKRYNFIYLATHGYADCEEGPCHTWLLVRDLPDALEDLRPVLEDAEWDRRGVEVGLGTIDTEHPGLSPEQAAACLRLTEFWTSDDPVPNAPGTSKPCLPDLPTEIGVTTEFFRDAYKNGLSDVVLFLAACQSLKVGDLAEHFTEGNRDVAVFGYKELVNDASAAELGRKAAELFLDPTYDSDAILTSLKSLAASGDLKSGLEAPFTGTVRGRRPVVQHARVALGDRGSNPTHARDVVELVNPLTGQELEDGGAVVALGAPGDGEPDRVRLQMRVRGIDEETNVDEIDVFLKVGDREESPSHDLEREVEPGIWAVAEEEVQLGFDIGPRETHDLEIRAELEGSGESRWRYEEIRFSTCFSRASWSGPFGGSYSSPYISGSGAQLSFPYPATDETAFGMGVRFSGMRSPPLEPGTFEPSFVDASFKAQEYEAVASYDAGSPWVTDLPPPVVRIHEVTDAYVRGTVEASLIVGQHAPKPFDPNFKPASGETVHVTVDFQYAIRHGGADCPLL